MVVVFGAGETHPHVHTPPSSPVQARRKRATATAAGPEKKQGERRRERECDGGKKGPVVGGETVRVVPVTMMFPILCNESG
ncbi:hypothetical protein HanIR_Chr12g0586371 [Helianthus annuus]|nr:hypothetical protein HanIR_Chr12g0586371 [Helianthus annuus]